MRLMMGDCLERMGEIDSGSVDAIICDPPYGTMKNAPSTWDASKTEWDTTLDQLKILEACNRILRPNGALLLFSQQPYTTKLISETHGNLPFSYCLTWLKDNFANALGCKKAPVNYTEDVCVFFKKYDTLAQHPLHDYAEGMLVFVDTPRKDIFSTMGHQGAFHWFLGKGSIQFGLCTAKTYEELVELYTVYKMDGFKEYAELVEIDKAHKATIARTFNLPPDAKYKSNVLEYRKDYRGEHPTQKPVALMEDLVWTYTNVGETVLDFTMGSGTTGVACVNLGREFIGIERDDKYFAIAELRIAEAVTAKAGDLF